MESRSLTPRSRPWKKWTSGCARSGSWHTRSSSERLRPRGITVSQRTMASSGYDSSSSCRMGPKGKRKYRLPILLQLCPGAGTRQLQEFRVLEITPRLIGEVAKDSLPKFPGEERVGAKIHTHIPAPDALSTRMSPDTLETGSSRVTWPGDTLSSISCAQTRPWLSMTASFLEASSTVCTPSSSPKQKVTRCWQETKNAVSPRQWQPGAGWAKRLWR